MDVKFAVGTGLGSHVGVDVGTGLGSHVGVAVGTGLGIAVGIAVGLAGIIVGNALGPVGPGDGDNEGF